MRGRLNRWAVLFAGAQTALALVLCFVPLFNLLAYEFCFAVTLLTGLSAPLLGLWAGREHGRLPKALAAGLTAGVAHLTPGLALMALNALRVQNCNLGQGLLLYALLPGVTCVYGVCLGVWTVRVLEPRQGAVLYVALLLSIGLHLGLSLHRLYTEPPIFAFDDLLGYFAGSLYDEAVPIEARLWLFRGGTVLRALGLMATAWALERWAQVGTPAVVATWVAAIAACATYSHQVGLAAGYRVDREALLQALPVTVSRPGLVLHLPQGVDAATQAALADDHAFRLHQLARRLEVHVEAPVHSWIYRDAAMKARLMGGHGTMVAKPWRHEVHIHGLTVPHPLVAHELAHVVAASFGSRLLGVSARAELSVNMGLVEGLAQALSPDAEAFGLHVWAHALRNLGLAPDLRAMMGATGFWQQAPARAYTVAGSFIRFLFERHGAGPLKAAYPHADFAAAYGQPLDALVAAWEAFVDQVPLDAPAVALAAERFRRPSIFARPCAHEVAELEAAARDAEPVAELALRRQIEALLPGALGPRVAYVLALARAEEDAPFLAQAAALGREADLSAGQRAELALAEAQVLGRAEKFDEAQGALAAVFHLPLAEPLARLVWATHYALGAAPPLAGPLLAYLRGQGSPVPAALALQAAARKRPSDPSPPYLLGRLLAQAGAWPEAETVLHQGGPHPEPAIEAERLRLCTLVAWRAGHLEAAAAAAEAWRAGARTAGEVAQADDWRERLRTSP